MFEGHENFFVRIFNMLIPSTFMLYTFVCTIILCVLFQLGFLYRAKKKEGKISILHFLGVYVFLFYLMHVYRVTGIPSIWNIVDRGVFIDFDRVYLIPFSTSDDVVPYLYNVFMTIPLGFFLPLLWEQFRSLKKIALTGFFFSLTIEVMQLFTFRVTSVSDLITNTLGAVLGYYLFVGVVKFIGRYPKVELEKDSASENIPSSPSWAIKHEPVVYLVTSFMGVFLLLNSSFYWAHFGPDLDDIDWENIRGEISMSMSGVERMGDVLKIAEDRIVFRETFTKDLGKEMEVAFTYLDDPDTIETAYVTEDTVFEIWHNDGQNETFVSDATLGDLPLDAFIHMKGEQDENSFVANKIIIWTFV